MKSLMKEEQKDQKITVSMMSDYCDYERGKEKKTEKSEEQREQRVKQQEQHSVEETLIQSMERPLSLSMRLLLLYNQCLSLQVMKSDETEYTSWAEKRKLLLNSLSLTVGEQDFDLAYFYSTMTTTMPDLRMEAAKFVDEQVEQNRESKEHSSTDYHDWKD